MLARTPHSRPSLERLGIRAEDRVGVPETLGRQFPVADKAAHVAVAHAGDSAGFRDRAVEREVHDVNCIRLDRYPSAPPARGIAIAADSRTPWRPRP